MATISSSGGVTVGAGSAAAATAASPSITSPTHALMEAILCAMGLCPCCPHTDPSLPLSTPLSTATATAATATTSAATTTSATPAEKAAKADYVLVDRSLQMHEQHGGCTTVEGQPAALELAELAAALLRDCVEAVQGTHARPRVVVIETGEQGEQQQEEEEGGDDECQEVEEGEGEGYLENEMGEEELDSNTPTYAADRAFDLAEDFEDGLFNSKRGGGCKRSTSANKEAHKLDQKMRRELRSGQRKASSKTALLQRPWRHGLHTYTSPDRVGTLHGSSRPCFASLSSSSSYAHAHAHAHPHEAARATPFAIARSAASTAFERALADLQHRELTPEDYELLLRLDESVKAKTLASTVIHSFPTRTLAEAGEGCCTICMDALAPGDTVRTLPCSHLFHADCIDQWLSNSSDRCPVDSLPVKK